MGGESSPGCPECRGTGLKYLEPVTYDNAWSYPPGAAKMARCRCDDARRAWGTFVGSAAIPEAYRLTERAKISQENRVVIERFAVSEHRQSGLWVSGPPGSGKSHLMAYACRRANELADTFYKWWAAEELLRVLWSYDTSPSSIVESGITVVDGAFDSGAESPHRIGRYNTLISTVYDQPKRSQLCFTSTLSMERAGSMLSETARSRLREMCYEITLGGEDRRLGPRPPA